MTINSIDSASDADADRSIRGNKISNQRDKQKPYRFTVTLVNLAPVVEDAHDPITLFIRHRICFDTVLRGEFVRYQAG